MEKEKLKTLKDLGFDERGKGDDEDIRISRQGLKAEAVKWVKERKYFKIPEGVSPHVHRAYMRGEREFIRHFFNLTDEDLE